MLPSMRNERGAPRARVRATALALLIGLVAGSAPIVVGPTARALRALDRALPGF